MRLGRIALVAALGALVALVGGSGVVAWLNVRGEEPVQPRAAGAPMLLDAAQVSRGEYLVRAGDCGSCHTEPGGPPWAGGRAVETPFGNVYSSNLTPDAKTGLGLWSADEFWRALHNGRAREGRLLYPAFPYPNFTRVTRSDADAMFAYLQSLTAIDRPNRPHALRFPVDTQVALALWRALFFRPEPYREDATQSAEWNRGAYLVEGLGHCNACHSARNALGATSGPLDLQGGLIPVQNWYAPSLASPHEAGVAGWPQDEVVRLLKAGVARQGFVMGPMGEVVGKSTQYLSDADAAAMVAYLRSLPAPAGETASAVERAPGAPGAKLYEDHCIGCHGKAGEGVPGAYPALAGSHAVTMRSTTNLVHIVLEGGFPPSTAGNARPFGMPPFANVLHDDEVAELLSFLRASWGNRSPAVSALEVTQARNGSGR